MLCENAAPEHLINVFVEFEYFVFISCKWFGLSYIKKLWADLDENFTTVGAWPA